MNAISRYSALGTAIVLLAGVAHGQQVNVRPDENPDAAARAGEPAYDGGGFRASTLIGARVRNAEGEDLGEIQDLLVGADNKVAAAVLSVGGFLDIGDKLIAIPYEELRLSTTGNLYLPTTKAQLAAKPEYRADSGSIAIAAVEPSSTPAASEPEPEIVEEANVEAQAESFAGEDPRVAEGIAENKEAYREEKGETE